MTHPRFIIHAPGFDVNVGGVLALHYLCHLLRRGGIDARLYPAPDLEPKYGPGVLANAGLYLRHLYRRVVPRRYRTHGSFDTPVMSRFSRAGNAVVVYPETVSGNPLNARHVVRWLLHVPGFHTGKVEYGKDDAFFLWQPAFNDPSLPIDPQNVLFTPYVMTDVYRQTNFDERSGTCYLMRKGRHRALQIGTEGKLFVDGMSHAETAAVFNRCKYFVSYDMHTYYSLYASLCGCIPVVWPEPGMTKEQWQPVEELRYGIAYGMDDLEYAIATRELQLAALRRTQQQASESVAAFVARCQTLFPGALQGRTA